MLEVNLMFTRHEIQGIHDPRNHQCGPGCRLTLEQAGPDHSCGDGCGHPPEDIHISLAYADICTPLRVVKTRWLGTLFPLSGFGVYTVFDIVQAQEAPELPGYQPILLALIHHRILHNQNATVQDVDRVEKAAKTVIKDPEIIRIMNESRSLHTRQDYLDRSKRG